MGNNMSTEIEARRCTETRKLGQRYEIAAKAVFADLERCGEDEKTADFDSDLIMEPDDGSGKDQGGSKDMKEKRRSRDQWWLGQW